MSEANEHAKEHLCFKCDHAVVCKVADAAHAQMKVTIKSCQAFAPHTGAWIDLLNRVPHQKCQSHNEQDFHSMPCREMPGKTKCPACQWQEDRRRLLESVNA
jgi:hypothetical protein